MNKPLVAIIGRPNVGKSSLFNRLVGRREAVITNIPGTTRDRIFGDVTWEDTSFILVDTGGLEPPLDDPLKDQIKAQVEIAIDAADLVLFMMDVEDGITPVDENISQWLRRLEKPLITVVNKVDNLQRELSAAEFNRLSAEEPSLISAYHNLGIHDLMDRTVSHLPATDSPENEKGVPKIAVVGRTNVGKSMLLNAILGEERAIVSEIAGTTRDSLDTRFTYRGVPLVFIDTAGIRRRGQVQPGVERYSVLRSLRSIERCDIAFMLMDATELATAQDAHVFGFAAEAFKGIIAVVNKCDLISQQDGTERERILWAVRRRFHFMPYVPIAFTSALTGEGIQDMLNLALDLYEERQQQAPHNLLSHVVMDALATHPPSSTGRKLVEIKEVRQVDINPPTFLFSVNDPKVHFSYRRYLENQIRKAFNYRHTHLRIVFKRAL